MSFLYELNVTLKGQFSLLADVVQVSVAHIFVGYFVLSVKTSYQSPMN